MEQSDLTEVIFAQKVDENNDFLNLDIFPRDYPSEITNNTNTNPNIDHSLNGSDDEEAPVKRTRSRVPRLSDSDSDVDKDNNQTIEIKVFSPKHGVHILLKSNTQLNYGEESNDDITISPPIKSRIQKFSSNEDSDLDLKNEDKASNIRGPDKKNGQQIHKKKKRNKLRQKEKSLLTSQVENTKLQINDSTDETEDENTDDESSSIKKIKQKIKERTLHLKTSICDPDTSDEEPNELNEKQKSTKESKLTSTKPIKNMSAKQAIENMQKIKSESNRMLREKEVSLPYHRPKALSLKDIMSRRKPAVTSDGKVLPIKMNDEQLKQYALLLEQRQKEMMELCKSDTDEELHENETVSEDTPCYISENLAEENPEETSKILSNIIETKPKENSSDIHLNNEKPEDILNAEIKFHNDSLINTKNNFNDVKENISENIQTEIDNQLISLQYDSENGDNGTNDLVKLPFSSTKSKEDLEVNIDNKDDFTDDDINLKDLSNCEQNINSQANTKEALKIELCLKPKPKLIGAPGMVIDLNGSDCIAPKKLSGVDLLKERFTYFAKLKSPEEMEKEREKGHRPGMQHLKLKQELEEKIAEQRSLEWAKRLEEEKQLEIESSALRGDASDLEDDIDKIEKKLEEKNDGLVNEGSLSSSSSESEEEEEEHAYIEKEKPRKRNPMIADEAEESDCDDTYENNENKVNGMEHNDENYISETDLDDNNDSEDESEDEQESSESQNGNSIKLKKGRILKAFEDSDEETTSKNDDRDILTSIPHESFADDVTSTNKNIDKLVTEYSESQPIRESQDEELQLAQMHKSLSEDLFASQDKESSRVSGNEKPETGEVVDNAKDSDRELSDTFSILNPNMVNQDSIKLDLQCPKNLNIICETQPNNTGNLDNIANMCSGSFSQNLVKSQCSQSQEIDDDVLALCTGQFYDNQFVSQIEDNVNSQEISQCQAVEDVVMSINEKDTQQTAEANILKSVLGELSDPEFESPKQRKFFCGANNTQNMENKQHTTSIEKIQLKKKFVIDSDDENREMSDVTEHRKKKILKKKKLERRALQISDDEDEEHSEPEEYMSDIEEDFERFVEYDSEENEVEVKPQNSKKKRKVADFFEQEAELTSEDEWVGSGDEDEAGLDRMEREEGDNETFHQGRLQRELGQIHMRDVLDQDKREVRLLQELLFEDGDLGSGHRQRKFRWRNADGEEEMSTVTDEFTDTQEEETESEEQWRKQRHEREMFLRQMQKQDAGNASLNSSINRTTIIKANLCSKTMSSLLLEVNATNIEKTINCTVVEKKTTKDILSPKKSFPNFQQNYHGSLLSRGRGALAQLAALATPLAADDDAPKIGSLAPTNGRNFVFASVTPEEPKVVKRKADSNIDTPILTKKLKTSENRNAPKSSLLDYLKN